MTTTLPHPPVPLGARTFHHPGQADRATLLETAAESGGRRSLFEVVVEPGGGNGLHRHLTYGERFTVVDGRLTVQVGAGALRLAPGESATAPPGAPHRFANESAGPTTFRVELTPGHRGFERTLQIGYGLAGDGGLTAGGRPKDPRVTGLLLEWAEMRLCGPHRALGPLVGPLAALARHAGLDRELEERYVRV
jgi:quercetin dioxygenase-like cupin family protein